MSVIFLNSPFPDPPQSEGAHDVADYNVTVTTDTYDNQTVVVQVIGRDVPQSTITDAVARATRAGLEAKTPPPAVTVNVNGTQVSGDDLARAIHEASQRGVFCDGARAVI